MVVDGRVEGRREGEGWSEERKPFHRVVRKHQVSLITTGLAPLGEPSYKENWFFLDIFRKGGGVSSNPKFP